jgi:hypothetical protein
LREQHVGDARDDLLGARPAGGHLGAHEANARIEPVSRPAHDEKVFVDGDDVCIVYDFVAKPPARASPTVEWYRVRDGKIAEIQIVFDTRPFAALRQD